MAIHVLGNGPSIRFFDRDAWPETDVFVGCNFSDVALRPNYTVLVDVAAMKQFTRGDNGYELKIPAILSSRAHRYLERDAGWNKVAPGKIDIKDVIPLERDRTIARRLAMNSGQHATLYGIRNERNHDTVHLWGIDSFWSTDLESKTDAIVRPHERGRRIKPTVTRQWNGYWHKIFSEQQKHRFVIHSPRDVKIVDGIADYSNVDILREEDP